MAGGELFIPLRVRLAPPKRPTIKAPQEAFRRSRAPSPRHYSPEAPSSLSDFEIMEVDNKDGILSEGVFGIQSA